MSKERTVNLSIENGVLVVECIKEIQITIPERTGFVYVDNIANENLAFSGTSCIVEYYLNIEPRYSFVRNFEQPDSAKYSNGMFDISIGEGQGCLITLPNSKENVFVYNESGLLCFRGTSKIIDKNGTTVFKIR